MKLRWHLLLLLLIFGIESSRAIWKYRNSEPQVGDAAEVHNIAYNLAHGRGYIFDWNDTTWRKLWQAQNSDGRFDFITARRGTYPTMSRPPLMPILVAGVIRVLPHASFAGWRMVDSAAFAAAASLLCDVAFVQGGIVTFIALLLILLNDPWRRDFIPGWWTEGLAFDFICLIIWLIANGAKLRPIHFNAIAGLAVGLLCLERSIFTLLMIPLCLLIAISRFKSARTIASNAVIVTAISILVQLPWWARNIHVSGRFLPLGTQGGINLPDEYSDRVLNSTGPWTGRAMRDAWAVNHPPDHAALPAGMTAEGFSKLWPYDPTDGRQKSLMAAELCTSLKSEIAVSDVGTRTAKDWIKINYLNIPRLIKLKAWAATRFLRIQLSIAAILCAIGFIGLPGRRRIIGYMVLLFALHALGIVLTHVVYVRFVVPIFPAIYLAIALGLTAVFTFIQRIIGRTPPGSGVTAT